MRWSSINYNNRVNQFPSECKQILQFVTALIELITQLVSVSFNIFLISSHIVNTYLRLIVTIYILYLNLRVYRTIATTILSFSTNLVEIMIIINVTGTNCWCWTNFLATLIEKYVRWRMTTIKIQKPNARNLYCMDHHLIVATSKYNFCLPIWINSVRSRSP